MFNTQAAAFVDLNSDGVLDLVFNNEGQESASCSAADAEPAAKTPVALSLNGTAGLQRRQGRREGRGGQARWRRRSVSGGDGRGGQRGLVPALRPAPRARTSVEVRRHATARPCAKDVTVAGSPMNVKVQ